MLECVRTGRKENGACRENVTTGMNEDFTVIAIPLGEFLGTSVRYR